MSESENHFLDDLGPDLVNQLVEHADYLLNLLPKESIENWETVKAGRVRYLLGALTREDAPNNLSRAISVRPLAVFLQAEGSWMARKRYSDEDALKLLREIDVQLDGGPS